MTTGAQGPQAPQQTWVWLAGLPRTLMGAGLILGRLEARGLASPPPPGHPQDNPAPAEGPASQAAGSLRNHHSL